MAKYKVVEIQEDKHLMFMKANTIATLSYEISKRSLEMRGILETIEESNPMDNEDYVWHSRKIAILKASIEKIEREWN